MGWGIRVIVNGCWGFASTDDLSTDNIAKTAALAVQIAKVNSKLIDEPVKLAPQKGYGEVSWKTPIEKNPLDVPLKDRSISCYLLTALHLPQAQPLHNRNYSRSTNRNILRQPMVLISTRTFIVSGPHSH